MTEKNKEIDLSQILNRLGIGLHALGFLGALINLIAGIVLENLFFIFVSSPMALLIGWGLRWILSGERTNIIPFYYFLKKWFKKLVEKWGSVFEEVFEVVFYLAFFALLIYFVAKLIISTWFILISIPLYIYPIIIAFVGLFILWFWNR